MTKSPRKQLEELEKLARPIFRAFGEGNCTGIYLRISDVAGRWNFNAIALQEVTIHGGDECSGTIYIPPGNIKVELTPNCPVEIVQLKLPDLVAMATRLK